jgi:hypothetical protein
MGSLFLFYQSVQAPNKPVAPREGVWTTGHDPRPPAGYFRDLE